MRKLIVGHKNYLQNFRNQILEATKLDFFCNNNTIWGAFLCWPTMMIFFQLSFWIWNCENMPGVVLLEVFFLSKIRNTRNIKIDCMMIIYMAPFKVFWRLTLTNVEILDFLKSPYAKSERFSTKTKAHPPQRNVCVSLCQGNKFYQRMRAGV